MDIHQLKLAAMATFCYVIGDRATQTCGLIDPAFETDRILAFARSKDFRVTHVINTHCHSDHTAGNAAVIAATGARLLIHQQDAGRLGKLFNSAFSRVLGGRGSPRPDVLLQDGDIIHIGHSALQVLHTPGHTPGCICLYADGNVFTGDTLFVGAVGRTDLPGGSLAVLLESLKKKLITLPPETIVWPGHDYGETQSSTIGHEMQTNPYITDFILER
jgi:glyoxylase-like metal-dependent hydrolase (beta-lactamase superfamily II)